MTLLQAKHCDESNNNFKNFFFNKMKTHFVKKELHILDNVRGKPITCIELGILSIGLYNGFNFCIYNELSKRKFGLDFLSCTARDL